jgi:carbon-monoxide dehydrogenase small subunit
MSIDPYALTVNGREHEISEGWPGESLLWVLRERLGLPGSKNACEEGECGSCSVRLDGEIVCSCLVLAASAVGQEITTVEGIAPDGTLSDVQQAFVDAGAVQCGFCTPGLIMAIDVLLDSDTDPDDLTVREAISGNLCRCTGYGRVIEAVNLAAAFRRGETDL